MIRSACMLAILLLPLARGAAAAPCVGDCDGDCRVTVDEIMSAVCISVLNASWCRQCPAMDANGNGVIAIHELIQAVNNALNGCPSPCFAEASPTPTATTEPTSTPTAEPTSTATAEPTSTAAPTTTPEPDPSLQATVDALLEGDWHCSQLWVSASTAHLNVHCAYGPGHDTDLSFSRRASAADAAAAVAASAAKGGAVEFRGAPAYLWEEKFPRGFLEFNYRYFRGQLGCWFISGESFDDTSYRLAYHPVDLAETIASASSDELLARCD